MATEKSKALAQIIRKIPIFKGLSPNQVQKVLSLCVSKSYEADEVLCTSETRIDEMFILVSGELAVIMPDGTQVATLEPVTTVGEMGIVTKQARTARIQATKRGGVLLIRKSAFDMMLSDDLDAKSTIYKNIIEILSDKMVRENVRTRDHLLEKLRQEETNREYRRRAEVAVKLLIERAGLSRDEAEASIDEQMIQAPLRVLIVDDEAAVRSFLCSALSSYTVAEAGNGAEALQLVKSDPPDLVITDLRMPEMSGGELLAELKKTAAELPVVALSGYGTADEAREWGFDGFIGKPVELEQFRRIIEKTIEGGE